ADVHPVHVALVVGEGLEAAVAALPHPLDVVVPVRAEAAPVTEADLEVGALPAAPVRAPVEVPELAGHLHPVGVAAGGGDADRTARLREAVGRGVDAPVPRVVDRRGGG